MTEYQKLKTVYVHFPDNSFGFTCEVKRNFVAKGMLQIEMPESLPLNMSSDLLMREFFFDGGMNRKHPMPTNNRPRTSCVDRYMRSGQVTALNVRHCRPNIPNIVELHAEIFVGEENAKAHFERRALAADDNAADLINESDRRLFAAIDELKKVRSAIFSKVAPLVDPSRVGYYSISTGSKVVTRAEAEAYAAKVNEFLAAIDALKI